MSELTKKKTQIEDTRDLLANCVDLKAKEFRVCQINSRQVSELPV